ncbi:hypothetical protein H7J08_24320 [Mycobacterium frederiksbergense]|uniref:Uncharacterized protein n=1 Tax=Mycolicibacterium frederiksbergense TaxID=117567 RepID=A0A6H0SEP2_9MYCO|nr:hypothetical protein [Mycolicibacterium frederiksbergense]MCV7047758.1 hypothetical protein [Mycolicibacterium frederiksbergense]MDO0977256.1 hypothetical protein [Mycolicibacterium frederiksbergense]QIV85031.1 hypothetical protein EXE63_32230 [Mycolicibacterium frederiksbergense]
MDSSFGFLSKSDSDLLKAILNRRNPELSARIGLSASVSRADAGGVISAISDELTDNLDADWEPTQHGKRISDVLARVNAMRIAEWPE